MKTTAERSKVRTVVRLTPTREALLTSMIMLQRKRIVTHIYASTLAPSCMKSGAYGGKQNHHSCRVVVIVIAVHSGGDANGRRCIPDRKVKLCVALMLASSHNCARGVVVNVARRVVVIFTNAMRTMGWWEMR